MKTTKKETVGKRYEKPRLTRVSLTITSPSLGACWSSASPADSPGVCQLSGCAE